MFGRDIQLCSHKRPVSEMLGDGYDQWPQRWPRSWLIQHLLAWASPPPYGHHHSTLSIIIVSSQRNSNYCNSMSHSEQLNLLLVVIVKYGAESARGIPWTLHLFIYDLWSHKPFACSSPLHVPSFSEHKSFYKFIIYKQFCQQEGLRL